MKCIYIIYVIAINKFYIEIYKYIFDIKQAIHSTSHSTLDRTCSDSVVSLCCRKSTSDLTAVTEGTGTGTPVVASHHRRRGSSKVMFFSLINIQFSSYQR